MNTRLQLSATQRQEILMLERRSFEEYCSRMNYSPHEHEAFILSRLKEEWNHLIETLKAAGHNLPDEAEEAAKKYLSASDLWSYKRLQVQENVERLSAQIIALTDVLPINWKYLRDLAKEIGLEKPSDLSPSSLRAFLCEIPHIHVFGNEFNAFVGRETLVDNLPCVCVYEQLIAASEDFLNVVMKQVLKPSTSGTVTVIDQDQWETIGSRPEFISECHAALEMVLARKDFAVHDPAFLLSRSWPEMQIPCRLMFYGASDFVRLHEYGHFLLGHLERQPSHVLEFEADRFAATVVAAQYANVEGASFWSKVGAMSILVMLALIEMIERQPPSQTHPSAEDRIAALLDFKDSESMNLFLHLQAMLGVCRRTVKVKYGIDYLPLMMHDH